MSYDIERSSKHPTRDFLKPVGAVMLVLGVGALVALSVTLATFVAAKYGIGSYRFRIYLLTVIVGFFLLAPGTFRLLHRGFAGWFHRGTAEAYKPN